MPPQPSRIPQNMPLPEALQTLEREMPGWCWEECSCGALEGTYPTVPGASATLRKRGAEGWACVLRDWAGQTAFACGTCPAEATYAALERALSLAVRS
jgi:hypothetical protein